MAASKTDYQLYPSSVYDAYRKVMSLARDMNTHINSPEIVLVGYGSTQRLSVIEAFLGHVVFETKGWTTKRPIHFKVVSNPEFADKPRVTIKRDVASKNYLVDMQVSLSDLASELGKRNTATLVPLVVQFDLKDCWNLTLIETPSLVAEGGEAPKNLTAEDIEAFVVEQMRTPQRIVVGVEECAPEAKTTLLEMVKSVDPKLDRSVFVFTSLSNHIKTFGETKDANQFFSSTLQAHNEKVFFLTLNETPESDPAKFREKVAELTTFDVESLEQLRFDRRFQNFVGAHFMRKHILDATWKLYQDNIPSVQNRLRALKANSEQTLEQLSQRIAGLDIFKLRSSASNFVMNFLSSTEKLIVGTLDGNPAQNGQTLQEEKQEIGEWFDAKAQVVSVPENDLPYADTRIYGGQQFERLLAEFKIVAAGLNMDDLPMDDVATAGGPSKLNNVTTVAWAASDLARRAVHRSFLPLLDQLIKRATAIMVRLTDIATKMMVQAYKKNKSRQNAAGPGARSVGTLRGQSSLNQQQEFDISPEEFPYYTHHVKDLFAEFVGHVADECREKCMDEFYCTKLIYWEVQQSQQNGADAKKGAYSAENVQSLSQEIFNATKLRITRNILLKCHNYFLVPMQSPLWGEIHGKVSSLSNQNLEELFEVPLTTQRLQDEQRTLQHILDRFVQQEANFQTASHAFSHPIRA